MATITLTIPDAQAARVADAFAAAYGYQPTIPNPDPVAALITPTVRNPETRTEFMRRQFMLFLQNTVKSVEVVAAVETARTAEMSKAPVSVS